MRARERARNACPETKGGKIKINEIPKIKNIQETRSMTDESSVVTADAS